MTIMKGPENSLGTKETTFVVESTHQSIQISTVNSAWQHLSSVLSQATGLHVTFYQRTNLEMARVKHEMFCIHSTTQLRPPQFIK